MDQHIIQYNVIRYMTNCCCPTNLKVYPEIDLTTERLGSLKLSFGDLEGRSSRRHGWQPSDAFESFMSSVARLLS